MKMMILPFALMLFAASCTTGTSEATETKDSTVVSVNTATVTSDTTAAETTTK